MELTRIRASLDQIDCEAVDLFDPKHDFFTENDAALIDVILKGDLKKLEEMLVNEELDARFHYLFEIASSPSSISHLLRLVIFLTSQTNQPMEFSENALINFFICLSKNSEYLGQPSEFVASEFSHEELIEISYWFSTVLKSSNENSCSIDFSNIEHFKNYFEAHREVLRQIINRY